MRESQYNLVHVSYVMAYTVHQSILLLSDPAGILSQPRK
jgi:hypothetical protein